MTRAESSRRYFVLVLRDLGGGSSPGYARHRTPLMLRQVAIVLMLTFDSQIISNMSLRKVFLDARKSSRGSCSLFLGGVSLLPPEGDDSSSSRFTALLNQLGEVLRSTLWLALRQAVSSSILCFLRRCDRSTRGSLAFWNSFA